MNELQTLIEKCRSHDRKAQFGLYKFWYSDLMRMATRYKKNREDAASLVNTSFFKAFSNIDKYEDRIPFEGWLRQIMKNTIIDEYRRESRIKETVHEFANEDGDEIIFSDDSVDYNLIEKKISSEEAEKILYSLDEKERMIFNMFEMDGYSHKEIAETMSISERTSKRYLSSAKANLLKILTKESSYSKVEKVIGN